MIMTLDRIELIISRETCSKFAKCPSERLSDRQFCPNRGTDPVERLKHASGPESNIGIFIIFGNAI